jgi:hypothetical protein
MPPWFRWMEWYTRSPLSLIYQSFRWMYFLLMVTEGARQAFGSSTYTHQVDGRLRLLEAVEGGWK